MNYETMTLSAVIVLVLILIVIRIFKKSKSGDKTSGVDIMTVALPLIQEAMDNVAAAKEDGEISEDEFVDLVAKQLHALLLESPLSDSEKALINRDLVEFAVKVLVRQAKKATSSKEEKKAA